MDSTATGAHCGKPEVPSLLKDELQQGVLSFFPPRFEKSSFCFIKWKCIWKTLLFLFFSKKMEFFLSNPH